MTISHKKLYCSRVLLIFLFLVKFYQLFKMLEQKNKKIPPMLETAQFVKFGFLHFGNTKIEVDILPKPS
jgi:hypothetical protein